MLLYTYERQQKTKGEPAGVLLWGKVMDPAAFLGVNVTLNIRDDFGHYFL